MKNYITEQLNTLLHFINTVPNALIYIALLILIIGIGSFFAYRSKWKLISIPSILISLAAIGFCIYFFLTPFFTLPLFIVLIVIPSQLSSLAISILVTPSKKSKSLTKDDTNPFLVPFKTSKRTYYLDLIRGFAIFGAAGSGKTKSGFLPVIKHCADKGLSGIIYDYKDFELSELVYYFFRNSNIDVKTIYLTDPDYSHKVNPIDPVYMNQTADMESTIKVFISNLAPGGGGSDDSFFVETAQGALAATAWRLKELHESDPRYKDKCTLPMAAGLLLMNNVESIAEFIKESNYASIIGAPFLDSMGSEKQMAAVKATLSGSIKKIMTPEIANILSKSDFSLRLNDPENPIMMTLVNNIIYENVHSPVIATIMNTATRQMSRRDQNPSLLLLDEGSTLKLPNLARIPATLRSYDIGTVWGLQDKVQGALMYDENTTKAVLANLTVKLFGKANDPDTMKFYERFFEIIETQQKSYSQSDNLLNSGDRRVNISTQEKAKHRAQEFMKLKAGEFFMFDDEGESHKLQFKIPKYEPVKPSPIYNYTKTEITKEFDDLLTECRTILQG